MANDKTPRWFKENVPVEVSDSQLFKFAISIGSGPTPQIINVDLTADLDVCYELVQQQLEEVPSQYVFWGSIYSELKLQCAKFERQIKGKKGQVTDRILKEAAAQSIKITDKQVNAIIESDIQLQELELKLAIYERNTGKVWFVVQALQMRADSLRSLAGFSKIDYNHAHMSGGA